MGAERYSFEQLSREIDEFDRKFPVRNAGVARSSSILDDPFGVAAPEETEPHFTAAAARFKTSGGVA